MLKIPWRKLTSVIYWILTIDCKSRIKMAYLTYLPHDLAIPPMILPSNLSSLNTYSPYIYNVLSLRNAKLRLFILDFIGIHNPIQTTIANTVLHLFSLVGDLNYLYELLSFKKVFEEGDEVMELAIFIL